VPGTGITAILEEKAVIRATHLGKCYEIYESPRDRLKQFVLPKIQRLMGRQPRRYYREFWALQDVSFEIARGETIGVIGRNGSGKSTLLQMICGTVSPTLGSVETEGRISALLELGAGFNPEFTGRENVYLNGAIFGLNKAEIDARFDNIAGFADIGDFIEQPVKTYSSGMYVRLAFAVSISVDPEILIVDEALSVGDARFQAKCMKRIKTIQQNGTSVLFVSHDVGSVRTLCERALWLDNGHLRMNGGVFPVTGSFMEHLFDGNLSEMSPKMGHISATDPVRYERAPKDDQSNENMNEGYDNKPVMHWGSHIGCIRYAGVYRGLGTRDNVIKLGEEADVRIAFKLPADVNRDEVCVAFSIKDLKGSDLIVSSTHDWKRLSFDGTGDAYLARFRFRNPLVSGQYLLVAAIENRSSPAIHYYEYLEGAHYFSSISDVRLFGFFQPEIHQEMVEIYE
jgi:lipopolysaccharide transport system ATP-binding protein